MKNIHKYKSDIAYIDFLSQLVLILLLMLTAALAYVNPKTKDGLNSKAEYVLTAEWGKNFDCDVDLWVQSPKGGIVFFHNKDVDMLHLDHDSMGTKNEVLTLDDGTEVSPLTYDETVSVRAIVPGEYTVNLNLYNSIKDPKHTDVPVKVKLIKINPNVSTKFEKEVVLHAVEDEITVLRFTLDAAGKVIKIDTDHPKSLLKAH